MNNNEGRVYIYVNADDTLKITLEGKLLSWNEGYHCSDSLRGERDRELGLPML
jgi:hypothetical protein